MASPAKPPPRQLNMRSLQIVQELKFGHPEHALEVGFPQQIDLLELTEPPKLTAILYKIFENDYNLVGIQLVFTNGFKTPMFQTYYAKMEGRQEKALDDGEGRRKSQDAPVLHTNVLPVDHTKTIATVAFRIQSHNDKQKLMGIKLTDSEGTLCGEVMWRTAGTGAQESWEEKEVPEGNFICGLKANVSSDATAIQSLSFLLCNSG